MSVRPDGRVFEALALAEYESAWGAPTNSTKRIVATLSDNSSRPIDWVMLALAAKRLGIPGPKVDGIAPADVPTAAFMLHLGVNVPDAVRFLLARRTGKGWRTTIESAWAILGLAAVLDRAGSDYLAGGRLAISVNGEAAREIVLPGRVDPSFDGRVSMPEPPGGWPERIVVRLTFEGRGTAFYTAALEGLVRGGEPASRGIAVTREYFEKDGDTFRPADGRLRVGRPVLVHLTVTATEPREYVMVSDPRPDGFEPVDRLVTEVKGSRRVAEGLSDSVDLSDGWQSRMEEFMRSVRGDRRRESEWAIALLREIIEQRRFKAGTRDEQLLLPAGASAASVEHRDDRTLFFLSALPAGTTHLYYMVRPEFAGDFRALPARAEPMYEPEVHGSGAESVLSVGTGCSAAALPLAPGVEGLLAVVGALRAADADELIAHVPSHPRVGDLLARVCDEAAFRAWLSIDSGPGVDAARRDVATRALCGGAPLPVLMEALSSERPLQRGLEGASAEADAVLAWAMEDRAMRLELLAQAQRLRGTARVDDLPFRPVTVARAAAALKPRDGVAWRLSQRVSLPAMPLRDLASRLERDLGLAVRTKREADLPAASGTVAEILDRMLAPAKLAWRVRDGAVEIGTLDELSPP